MEPFPLKVFTVSELTSRIRDLLEGEFDEVLVEGEISNLRVPRSGHLYFTLKDERSQMRAVLFKTQFRYLRFDPEDGQHVLCWGRLSVYEPRGEYQLLVDYMEPKGLGALQLAFEQLKERLASEGLFDPSRKRPLPLLPRKIGIVTSPTGAVIRDMLHILRRRFENIEVLLYPVRVQGEGAAEEIAQGIEYLSQRGDIDVIIVARGGGSLEDLWAFNEEVVARSIYRSQVPVISAVGHETDYTIADFVADLRAPTPSAAAELVVRQKEELKERVEQLRQRLHLLLSHSIAMRQEAVRRLQKGLKDPRSALEGTVERLKEASRRLSRAWGKALEGKRNALMGIRQLLMAHSPKGTLALYKDRLRESNRRLLERMEASLKEREGQLRTLSGKLHGLSPLAVLGRGYSITWRLPDRRIIKDSREVQIGDTVEVTLAKGGIRCRVKERH